MPRFLYEALDQKGRFIKGIVEAPNAQQVVEDLRSLKCTVTNVRETAQMLTWVHHTLQQMQGASTQDIVIFTRQFATIFNSGIPLLRGIEGLAKQTVNKRLASALVNIQADVKNGMTLWKAMQKQGNLFTNVYISLVRAGEISGTLGIILDRMATYLEKDFQLRKKVQSATVYPLFVIVFAIILAGLLVMHVFPVFVNLFEGIDMQLPWPTRLLIFVTNLLRDPAFLLVASVTVIVTAVLINRWLQTPTGRRQYDMLLLEIPLFGPINRKVVVARICRTLSTLLSSGVPMITSLDILRSSTGNEIVADILEQVRNAVKAGMRLSQPLREYHVFPPMLPQMLAVGEESGSVPEIMHKLANFYDGEISANLDMLAAAMEPILIGATGLVVGFVLLAVFMPVYQILQEF